MMYRITRQVCDTRPSYTIEAATEDEAVAELAEWLGGAVNDIVLIEEWSQEQENEAMKDAGYVP